MTTDDVPLTPEQEKRIKDTVTAYTSIAADVARSLSTVRAVWADTERFRAVGVALNSMSERAAEQMSLSIKPMMDQARMLAEFQRALPKMVIDFPKLANAFSASPAFEQLRAVIQQSVQIPPIALQSDMLRTLRAEAEASVASLKTPDAMPLDELLTELEEVEDAARREDVTRPGLSHEARAGLTLGVAALVVDFLAKQEVILRTAFEDAAAAGAALTKVWPYVAALVAALLAAEKIRRGD